MYAFAPSTSLTAAKPAVGATSFVTPLATRETVRSAAPTMILRNGLVRASPGVKESAFGGASDILTKADQYMAYSVQRQYLHMTNPSGIFSTSCTEGASKGAAEFSRIRALNTKFRASQVSASKKYFDMYEFRKQAVAADHICSVEESQFCNFSSLSEKYCLARSEALGTCSLYATPETVEESAMARYMDIQQKNAVNPSGVYNSSCNEGAAKGQAEQLRVNALNAAFRNGQKPVGRLLQEKYNQRQYGYVQAHGCTYEEGLISLYPAIGASFRSKAYGY